VRPRTCGNPRRDEDAPPGPKLGRRLRARFWRSTVVRARARAPGP
jgi:hypothetical protein